MFTTEIYHSVIQLCYCAQWPVKIWGFVDYFHDKVELLTEIDLFSVQSCF